MRLLRCIAVALAEYSRIPVPRFEWEEKDMQRSMAAFPLVGAIIGAVYYAVYAAGTNLGIPVAALAFFMTAVPVIISGGFHLDGFMDVADALSSYRTREEKLEILKDPHIGAFAVIRLALTGMIYIGSLITLLETGAPRQQVLAVSAGFVLSRALSAMAVILFKPARKNGMMHRQSDAASKSRGINMVFTVFWIAAALALMRYAATRTCIFAAAAGIISFGWYRYKSYREFGGITGDTAGYFVVICELSIVIAAALSALLPA